MAQQEDGWTNDKRDHAAADRDRACRGERRGQCGSGPYATMRPHPFMTVPGAATNAGPAFAGTRVREALVDAAPVLVIAIALIVLRVLAYLLFEQLGFDSDQAVYGLMAKHLSEGRAFPLFFYGQTYMLGVVAWVAVPFFWIGGPTVATLRVSLLAWNIAFAVLLIVGLHRDAGLRYPLAIVPALFFVAAPPSVANQLIQARGVIEPFVYVGVLWFLRGRPLWFGAMLAIGFRSREFTMYAVPVLLAIDLLSGGLTRSRLREWLLAAVIFLVVSESISALMPFADLVGPGTRGDLLHGFSGSAVGNLVDRFNGRPTEFAGRVATLVPALFQWFVGTAQVESSFSVRTHPCIAWLAAALFVAVCVRLLVLLTAGAGGQHDRRSLREAVRDGVARAPFAWYLLGTGLVAAASFIAAKPVLTGYARYAVLGLLTPVGLTAAILALERAALVRRTAIVFVVAWTALAVTDDVTVLRAMLRQPPPNPIRELADALIARQIPVAAGGYWDAYITTFVAQERVLVASNDFVRIQEYQNALADHVRDARTVSLRPCAGGERVARWYLCSFP